MTFLGLTAALGSAVAWSLGSILFSQLGRDAPSEAMTAAKGFLSVLFLTVALLFAQREAISLESFLILSASGVLGIALGDTLFFAALQRITPHAVVTIMMTGHVLTVLGAVWWLNERPSSLMWTGIAAALIGVFVVLYSGTTPNPETARTRAAGILFGFLSVAAMAGSIIMAKRTLEITPTIQATLIRMTSGTACMLALGLFTSRLAGWTRLFASRRLAARFTLATAVVTFGGFWLSIIAFKYAPVSVANTLLATEPLFVLLLSWLLLKTPILPGAVLGSLLTIAGVACILWQQSHH